MSTAAAAAAVPMTCSIALLGRHELHRHPLTLLLLSVIIDRLDCRSVLLLFLFYCLCLLLFVLLLFVAGPGAILTVAISLCCCCSCRTLLAVTSVGACLSRCCCCSSSIDESITLCRSFVIAVTRLMRLYEHILEAFQLILTSTIFVLLFDFFFFSSEHL